MKISVPVGGSSAMKFVLIGLVSVTLALHARASVIHPGEKLIIDFSFAGPPVALNGQPVDFIWFLAGASFTNFDGSLTFNLFGGTTLLGTATTTQHDPSWRFRTANNEWVTTTSSVVDFSTIQAGTIQGRFEFIPTFTNPIPSSNIDLDYEVRTGDAISFGSYWAGPAPAMSVQIVAVPEPSTTQLILGAALIASGVNAGVRRLHRRSPTKR